MENDRTREPADDAGDGADRRAPRPSRDLGQKHVYGESENFGSPGGDEPPPGTDPGRGAPTDARERH